MQDAFVLSRWATFNAIGLAGMAVQLAVLTLLVRVLGVHYLTATVVAVEAALLHNFAWHQRWTWRDRPAASRRASLVRLVRFHLLNGSVSFGGNLLVMAWLSGRLKLDPVIANLAAVTLCSAVNFALAHLFVFAGRPQARAAGAALVLVLAAPLQALSARGASPAAFDERCIPGACVPPRSNTDGILARRAFHPTTHTTRGGGPGLAAGRSARLGATRDLHHGLLADDGATLKAGTLAAWQAYERAVDERYTRQIGDGFFAQDAFAPASAWRQAALDGATPMLAIRSTRPGAPEPDVPDGRINHWAGATFIPGVTLDAVLRYLDSHAGQEAGKYDDVVSSKLLGRDGNRLRVFLKLRRTKVITATYNTEHSVEYRRVSSTRASGRSVSTRIAELADAGTAGEREKPPGDDSGYLWRLNAYWRYEQVGGGVLIECESVSLSRSVPALLRPFISGIVEGVARESLEKTLRSLRVALAAGAAASPEARQPQKDTHRELREAREK